MINARKRNLKLPEIKNHRSAYAEWNHGAEVYSFGQRLSESFDIRYLNEAFVDRSYIIQEEKQQRAVGIEEPELQLKDNRELADEGEKIISSYVDAFVRHHLPLYPEEGISAVKSFLLSDERLARVSSLLGTKDIILASVIAHKPPLFN